jgi:hypothetical protein
MTTVTPRLDRVTFKTSRLLDFVGRLLATQGDVRPELLAGLDFSSIKLRLIGSIAAIAAIRTWNVTTDPEPSPSPTTDPAFRRARITGILDYTAMMSSLAYVSLRFAAQGNALKTVLRCRSPDGEAGETAIETAARRTRSGLLSICPPNPRSPAPPALSGKDRHPQTLVAESASSTAEAKPRFTNRRRLSLAQPASPICR